MQDQRVPEHNDQRPVFFGVPAPEAAPGVVRPETTQHGADEAEEDRKADRAVDHPRQIATHRGRKGKAADPAQHVEQPQKTCQEGGRVAQGDTDHVCGQPELGIQYRLHDDERIPFHGGDGMGQLVPDQQRGKAHH